jgi:hypothetical protein
MQIKFPSRLYAAIDAHFTAVAETDRQIALDEAGLIGDDCSAMQAAMVADWAAARALIGTAPTTLAGLRALDDYLRHSDARWFVRRPGADPWDRLADPVNWLIAKRAAELAARAQK